MLAERAFTDNKLGKSSAMECSCCNETLLCLVCCALCPCSWKAGAEHWLSAVVELPQLLHKILSPRESSLATGTTPAAYDQLAFVVSML